MKNLLSIAGKFFLILFSINSFAQEEIPIVIEDFIEHEKNKSFLEKNPNRDEMI